MSNKYQHGMTLVELIIAMVIVAAGLAGVLGALSRSAVVSADPLVAKQLRAMAEGMMEEIQLKPFGTPAASTPGICARTGLEKAGDYNNYNFEACALDGSNMPLLDGYRVNVDIKAGSGAVTSSDSPTDPLLIPANDTIEITVTVSRGALSYVLSGWRTNYGAP